MFSHWQLQEAKNRLSQLVRKAVDEGPQVIDVHGKPTAIVVSMEEYEKLKGQESSLIDFFIASPLAQSELDVTRSSDESREVEL